VFHVLSDDQVNLALEIWGGRRFEKLEFKQAMDDLKNTRFERFSDRFLRVNVTPGNIDWFDDEAWSVVLNNFAVAAVLSKESGSKGLLFDVEQYTNEVFNYESQNVFYDAGMQTYLKSDVFKLNFSDLYLKYMMQDNAWELSHIFKSSSMITEPVYKLKVRQRGQEWMRSIRKEFPDITIFLTFGYSIAHSSVLRRGDSRYGLLASFFDGILDVATAQATIVDGWEHSYTYLSKKQFQDAYDAIKVRFSKLNVNPDMYKKVFKAGFGIYMDAGWSTQGWSIDDTSKNYFSPERFEQAVQFALEISDRYVWIYSEQPNWWTGQKLPEAYVNALWSAADGYGKRGSPPKIP
jgi:hypothetical protein